MSVPLGAVLPGRAGTVTWTNAAGGNWSDGLNWNPNGGPGIGDTAVLPDVGNSYAVTLDGPVTISGLVVGATSGVNTQIFSTDEQTLTVNGVIQVNSHGVFDLNGGKIAGTYGLVGALAWSGGALTGAMTVSNNGVLNIAAEGGDVVAYALSLTNYGTVNWNNTPILADNGDVNYVYIYNYGLWSEQNDDYFNGNYNNGPGTVFNNFGTFRKSGTTGTTTLDHAVTLNNTGTVDVESGTLLVNGGGTNSGGGSFTNAPGTALDFNASYTVANGTTFAGAGHVALGQGGAFYGVITTTNLELAGGTLSGTNGLAGTLTWSGGILTGAMTVSNHSVLNIASGGSDVYAYALSLTNYGTVIWTNTAILGDNGDVNYVYIYNYGLWDEQSDDYLYGNYNNGPGTVFDNFGTFLKSGNTGTTTLDHAVTLNNTGTVDVESGTLLAGGGGVNSGGGSFTNAPGTALDFNASYTVANGTTFAGAGNVVLAQGGAFYGVITSTNLDLAGGTLSGTNGLVGTLTWSGGSLTGAMTVSNNGVLNIAAANGDVFAYALSLTNYGTVNWTNAAILADNGDVNYVYIYNYGLWNEQGDDSFYGNYNNGPGTVFNNFGTFRKSGNLGTTTLDHAVTLNNTGTVDAESGTLMLTGGGTSSDLATFNAASGAAIDLGGGYNAGSGLIFSGAGSLALAGGLVTINGAIMTTNLQLAGATLAGTNVLVGTMAWSGGALTGAMTVSNHSVLNIAAANGDVFAYALSLTNYGTVNWTNTAILADNGDANYVYIYNYGLWNEQSDDYFYGNYNGGPGTVFNNFGTFRKSGNLGTTTLNGAVTFNNTGTVDVQSGFLSVTGLRSAGGTFTGSGVTQMSSGTDMLNGLITSANLQLVAGTLAGTNVLAGTLTWSGGYLTGAMTVSNNGVLNIAAANADVYAYALSLTNYGTVNWTNTAILADDGDANYVYIYNYGLWNEQSDDYFYGNYNGGPGTVFYNFGTFRKSGNTGTTTLDAGVTFTNAGALDAQSGTISLNSYDLTGGTLNFGISGLSSYGVVDLAGSPALTGAISANLNSNYIPMVNNTFQVLNFASSSGSFTQTNLPPVAVWQTAYNPANVTLQALKLVPRLTWTNPANLLYGIPLNSAQLDAAAASPTNLVGNLAGMLTYTPPLGTHLLAGSNQTLSVSFAPADSATYTNVAASVIINVLKAPLTITATNQTKIYGQTRTFAGTEFTTAGLMYSDSVTSVSLGSPGAAPTATVAGSPYTITNSAAAGSGLVNYIISYASGALAVSPAPLTVTAGSRTKTYGQLVTFAGTEFTASGLLNSDSIASVTLTSSGAAANATVAGSPYNIVPSAALGSGLGNYTIGYVNGVLTVTAPVLNIAGSPPNIVLSWTTNASAFVLNRTPSLTSPITWTPVTSGITISGTNNTYTTNATNGNQTFQLIAPQ